MTTQLNGDGTIPAYTAPAPVAVTSISNATPPVVTSGGSHGYATGDTVLIEGNSVAAYNKLWQVTVLTAGTYSLNGGTASGAGTGGQSLDYSINPEWTIISDGDNLDATILDPPHESAADQGAFISTKIGRYQVVDVQSVLAGTPFTTFSTTALNSSTWTDLGVTTLTGGRYLATGDVLQLKFSSSVSATASSGVSLTFALNIGGGGATAKTTMAVDFLPFTSGVVVPIAALGQYTAVAGDANKQWIASIVGLSNASTPNIILSGGVSFSVVHLKPNYAI